MPMPFSPCPSDGEPCTDQSVAILREVFGPVIDQLAAGADPDTVSATANILASMFSVFNSGVLVVGSLIVSYVAAVGVLNTANDGEAMGRNWSSLWTPVRIVAGGASLLPTASGFSFIQLFGLMVALWGVGLANAVYDKGVTLGLLKPEGLIATVNDPGSQYGLRQFARQYVAASYCANAANSIFAGFGGNTPQVRANSEPDRVFNAGGRREYVFEIKDRNRTTNLAGGAPICGTVKVAEYHAQPRDDATAQATEQVRAQAMEQKKRAAVEMMGAIDRWVITWPDDVSKPGWDSVSSAQFNAIVSEAEQKVVAGLESSIASRQGAMASGLSAYVASLTNEGWATAGGWLQKVGLVRTQLSATFSESVGSVTEPSLTGLPNSPASDMLANSVGLVADITRKAESHDDYTSGDIKPDDLTSAIPTDPMAAVNVGQIQADMDAKMSSWVNRRMEDIVDIAVGADGSDGTGGWCGTAGLIGGSLNRMKCVGDYFSATRGAAQTMKTTLLTAVTVVRVAAGVIGGTKVLGNGFEADKVVDPIWDWIKEVIIPPLAELEMRLETLAFYFGVFLPSLPYALFILVICGWVLSVIQTLLAAPLWAVMHMTPDKTFIGSQRQGYLLLMSLFARPVLAVIGLFAGILISDPLVNFASKGFFAMRGAIVTSTGTVGAISEFFTFTWWMYAFALMLLPIFYMCFGLPQVLPDKVLQWIGGGVADLGETSALGEMRTGLARAHAYGRVPGKDKDKQKKLGGGGGNRPLPGSGPRGDGGGSGGGGGGNQPVSGGGQGVTPRLPPPSSPGGRGQGDAGIGPAGPSAPGKGGGGRDPIVLTQSPQGAGPRKE